jgi:carbamoyl-phosphate synthase large subunit
MPKEPQLNTILIIGSGPIVIGQACEFDYSGTQAARALQEAGVEVVLINSNPATIMTDPMMADHVYLRPLTRESIAAILEAHTIDAVLPTLGGQTALNLCVDCDRAGLWAQYGVRIIGSDMQAIQTCEDREAFRALMHRIGIDVPTSGLARSFLAGKELAQRIGFPLVIRPSYTLGGSGGAFVENEEDLPDKLRHALQESPVHEVLIEESIFGWKEFELEVMRDVRGNFIVICTIENMDPTGIHTGDSVTVAPALTLPDTQFQQMRDWGAQIMDAIGDFSGGCNIQYAIHPETGRITCIEVNPRVSRSSALASKATGYPIAKIAAKLGLGYTLDELPNQITGTTTACFEPSIDYVIVKIPRWDFAKFEGADHHLGLQMKSVGEVMAIGRSFNEALQKACQSLEINRNGLGADARELTDRQALLDSIANPTWNRLFHLHDALIQGVPLSRIRKITEIDPWFLHQINEVAVLEHELQQHYTLETIDYATLLRAKQMGFGDRQLGHLLGALESQVHARRRELGVRRVYKMVDTCAAEFDAQTPYYYSTFEGENESTVSNRPKVLILGSGPNRIGQGIEFDYCCVHGVLAAKEAGYETIMLNCNPETVSTDFDIADKLYFEPVFWEHVWDLIQHEQPEGVIVQLGGQTALKLGEKLTQYGVPLFGTPFESINFAEDRGEFSDLLQRLAIPYPPYGAARDADEALALASKVGYPVLVRPSYVLGGQRMRIVINDEELEAHLFDVLRDLPDNHILIDHFLDGAIEAEVDALCDGEAVHIMGIMEHIEPAGIHSGDSTCVLPAFHLSEAALQQIEEVTRRLAFELRVVGLINVQVAVQPTAAGDRVYVIEANPRASRTVPFIGKAHGLPYVNIATKLMLGTHKLRDFTLQPQQQGYAIKRPVFSFNKFPNVDKSLGPEMKSTGEEIRFIANLQDPFFEELYAQRSMYLTR